MNDKRFLIWGTADLGKPRTRILIDGLKSEGVIAGECLFDVWDGVEDKSQLKGVIARLVIFWRYLIAYPVLIWRYLTAPKHDAVFVAYMGHFDVIILWPFAKLRGAKIVWDAFLSLYDTVVEDRKLVGPSHPLAHLVSLVEKLSCMAADVVILDTQAHADYFRNRYKLKSNEVISVWVGAETRIFHPQEKRKSAENEFNILFYGQFIPLHGIGHIVEAARRIDDPQIKWTLIGRGQEREKVDAALAEAKLPSVTLIDWVDYEDLPEAIAGADLCLGVFGDTEKAGRVIPNKVFQILAMGRPLITRDSAAIREIVTPETEGVWLVAPGSGEAIANAVTVAKQWLEENPGKTFFPGVAEKISPEAVALDLVKKLETNF